MDERTRGDKNAIWNRLWRRCELFYQSLCASNLIGLIAVFDGPAQKGI